MKFNISLIRRTNLFVAGSISMAYLLGKSLRVKIVKSQMELKVDDKLVPIPAKLQTLIDQVTNDFKLKKATFKITPFMSKGCDVKSITSPLDTSEVFLAIPECYIFDVDYKGRFTAVVDGKELPDSAPLKEAMFLSDEAKKFGMAHEIFASQQSVIFPCGLLPLFVIVNCNGLSIVMERFHNYLKKPLHPSNHCFVFFLGAWMYGLLYDLFSVYSEARSDFRVTELGKSYVKGGIEYYEKMIKRNKLLKKFNPNAPYDTDGDLNLSLIRTTHMPLQRRILYLSEINRGKAESVWTYILNY